MTRMTPVQRARRDAAAALTEAIAEVAEALVRATDIDDAVAWLAYQRAQAKLQEARSYYVRARTVAALEGVRR